MIEIHEHSEAHRILKLALQSGRTVRIDERRDGIAVKTGEGMWTHTMSTEEEDKRRFRRGECDHLICLQCGGHKLYRETWPHESEDSESLNHNSCMCCKHCNRQGGH
jgi:hypothetical protein